jgi:Flp pilus assembly protein TadD
MAQIGYSIFIYDIRGDAAVHNELGILLLQYKKFREAVAEFESVTVLEPRVSTAYANLGVAYSFLTDFEQAEKAFRRALELEPDNETAKKGLAVIGH